MAKEIVSRVHLEIYQMDFIRGILCGNVWMRASNTRRSSIFRCFLRLLVFVAFLALRRLRYVAMIKTIFPSHKW